MRALALLYHDVVAAGEWDASGFPGFAPATYKLERGDFVRHLKAVSAAVARRGTVHDLQPGSSDPPPVLLTFDDGGASAYPHIASLLEQAGWRGHFFVPTDYLGTPGFVTPAHVRELAARGHTVGSHSCSHPLRMSACPWDRLVDEWARSTSILSEVLGQPVRVASVPGGAFSRRVAVAAAAAGIRVLFTSEPTARCRVVDGCLVVGRYLVRRGTSAHAAAALASGHLGPRLRQWWFWNVKKAAKAVGGTGYATLRQLVCGPESVALLDEPRRAAAPALRSQRLRQRGG